MKYPRVDIWVEGEVQRPVRVHVNGELWPVQEATVSYANRRHVEITLKLRANVFVHETEPPPGDARARGEDFTRRMLADA